METFLSDLLNFYTEIYFFLFCLGCLSSDALEPHVETSGHSAEEAVVLGVQRCRQEVRSPRYVTEPCILCQEQQDVSCKRGGTVEMSLMDISLLVLPRRNKRNLYLSK